MAAALTTRRGLRSATAGWPSSTGPAANSPWPTKTGRSGSSSTARSTTTSSCAATSRRAAIASAPTPTPKPSCTPTKSMAMRASTTSTACLRLPSATQNSRRVLLARDRLGKKPLFHATLGGVLHFASEIKAIKASPLWNGELDLDSVEGYLSLGYFVAPATAYRHVRKLEPGTRARHRRRARLDSQVLGHRRRSTPTRGARGALVDEVDARLSAAVSRRLESEVPIGAFLSGGIDSGLVVLVHGRGHGHAAGHRLGRASTTPRTTSWPAAGLTAARYRDAAQHRDRRSAPRGRARSDRRCVRRAVRRSVGDSDLLRQPDGAPARHGGAVGRWRRRSVRRLRLALHAARHGGAGAPADPRRAGPQGRRLARRALAALARVSASASAWATCSRTSGAIRPAPTTPTCAS